MIYSQNINIGTRLGGFITGWENTGSFMTLQSRSTRMWSYNIYGRQEILDNLYLGMDLGYSRSTAELNVIEPERNIARGNGPTLGLWSIGPTIRKDFPLSNGKLGFHTSLSIPLNYTSFRNYEYSGSEFRTVVRVGDNQPITDIYVYGEDRVQRRFSVFVRPEVGVFYNVNARGRISFDLLWGINSGGPLVTRDFNEIIYEGETLNNNYHKFNGQYFAFTIGYEYKLFK